MNAARRLPRVHGISTVVCSAVVMTDLIKRLFMVALVSYCSFVCSGLCLLLSIKLPDQSGRFGAESKKVVESKNFICGNFERFAKIDAKAHHPNVLWEKRVTYARNWHQFTYQGRIVHSN